MSPPIPLQRLPHRRKRPLKRALLFLGLLLVLACLAIGGWWALCGGASIALTAQDIKRAAVGLSVIFTAYTFTRHSLIWLQGHEDPHSLSRSPYWILTLVSTLNFSLLFTVVMSAIAVKETVGKLRKERDLDALTQLLNRRSFQDYAQKLLADKRLYPMAVIVGDIDHFKRVNDTWGHERGDRVLQLVATRMKNNVRGGDLLARFGGEEFLMLLSDISLETAERIAQRIQRDLAKKNTVLPYGPIGH